MWKVAVFAYMPVASLLFGILAVPIFLMPAAMHDLRLGATLLYGAAGLSFVLAAPLSWFVARRMLTRKERRRIERMADKPA